MFFFKDIPQMILRTSQVWEPLDLGSASQTDVRPADLKGVMCRRPHWLHHCAASSCELLNCGLCPLYARPSK
jgi:hypothetical protein